MLNMDIPAEVHLVAQRIAQAGGDAVLVGGAVIDIVQNRRPKDWDLEVFKIGFSELERIFEDMNPKTVGKAFGIIKLNVDGVEVDLNVPRTDNKIGVGHKDFEVQMDPHMTIKEAARRRDFTINAMAYNINSRTLIDPFGGLRDLSAGCLRATDPELFVQDSLRGLRAMQLLSRKAKMVDCHTMMLIRGMAESFPYLPKERIYEEWRKLLLKAEKPSVGLEFLRESGWLKWFPELEAMIGCEQRPEWHPEGDVWIHSLLAADAMAQVRNDIPEHQREAFAFGVFLHDVGKPAATITAQMINERHPRVKEIAKRSQKDPSELILTAYGHDKDGMDPAEQFLLRMTENKKLITLVRAIVGQHMQPYYLYSGDAKKGSYAKLHRKMQEAGGDLRLIGQVCKCDACATSVDWQRRSLLSGEPNWEHQTSQRVFDYAEEFDRDLSVIEPKVMGRDLVAAGLKPGPELQPLLKTALEIQDSDATLSKEDILTMVLPPVFLNPKKSSIDGDFGVNTEFGI